MGCTSEDESLRLELYKLAVEMADRTSSRRATANSFFVTLHATLAAIVGIVGMGRVANAENRDHLSLALLAVVGAALSIAWWALLRYYRRLNAAKFSVINSIERWFPVKIFTDEWALLRPDDGSTPRRWHRNPHREATAVEQVVPVVFLLVYVCLGIRIALT